MKFKVGDRVKAIGKVDGRDLTGKTGTVVSLLNGIYNTAVEFDEDIAGHDCDGKAKSGHGRYGKEEEFELISNDAAKIVITVDGREVLARLYDGKSVIKSASAKCNPADRFDIAIGAKLAFERLMGTEEKKEETPKFEVGKLYSDGDRIIRITNEIIKRDGKCYDFEVLYGKVSGVLGFAERSMYATDLKPYEPTFKVGDRVKVIDKFDGKPLKGKCGTVCEVGCPGAYECGVEFDENIGGHACSHTCAYGHGRWGKFSELIPCDTPKKSTIEVGDKVKVIKSGSVYRHYEDWVKAIVTDRKLKYHWAYGEKIAEGAIGTVRYIDKHLDRDETLAYIECDDRCYIFGIEGLEKC